jgi:hypothetical protein
LADSSEDGGPLQTADDLSGPTDTSIVAINC